MPRAGFAPAAYSLVDDVAVQLRIELLEERAAAFHIRGTEEARHRLECDFGLSHPTHHGPRDSSAGRTTRGCPSSRTGPRPRRRRARPPPPKRAGPPRGPPSPPRAASPCF